MANRKGDMSLGVRLIIIFAIAIVVGIAALAIFYKFYGGSETQLGKIFAKIVGLAE